MILTLIQAAPWTEDAIAKATIVIATSTVIYVIATILLWLTTRRSVITMENIYEAAHRPYVYTGVEMIRASDEADDEEDEEDWLRFEVSFHNVGTVPAHNLQYSVRVIVDGSVMPIPELEKEPFTVVFPNLIRYATVITSDPKDIESITAAKTLSVDLKCTYEGVTGKRYTYNDKAVYDDEDGEFFTEATAT